MSAGAENSYSHESVMLDNVLAALQPRDNEVYVDATFGNGGYTRAFLASAECRVIALDRDPLALTRAKSVVLQYGDRFEFLAGCFGDAQNLIDQPVDGFVMDVGVSSMQIDDPSRGFSFRHDGPLDMRMNPDSGDKSAAFVVNKYEEANLADIIYQYGQERHSRRVARAIIKARSETVIETTFQLADIVRSAVPFSKKDKINPATRTFQALRIHVNRELDELKAALQSAEILLKEGGRLIVVSFHSLEDVIVKNFMRERAGLTAGGSRYLPEAETSAEPAFHLPSRKAVFPNEEEIKRNPRARSARMRVAIKGMAV